MRREQEDAGARLVSATPAMAENPREEPNQRKVVISRAGRQGAGRGLTIVCEYEPDAARCAAALLFVLDGGTKKGVTG
jgi:hypothetical protein